MVFLVFISDVRGRYAYLKLRQLKAIVSRDTMNREPFVEEI